MWRSLTTETSEPQVEVARIVAPHGLKGEARVALLGGGADRLPTHATLHIGDGQSVTVERLRPGPRGNHLLTVVEWSRREDVEPHVGEALMIRQSDLPQVDEGTAHFATELEGFRARDENDVTLGVVVRIDPSPAHDLLVVSDETGREDLFPFVPAFIANVDREKREVTITPWEWVDEV